MGHGHDQPPQATSGRGAPLTGLSRRALPPAAAIVALAALWTLGGALLFAAHADRHHRRLLESVTAVSAVLEDTADLLRREARLLAEDPSVVEGVSRGDWRASSRGASSRLQGLMAEGLADLVLVLDASGAPVVQMPVLPRLTGLTLPRPAEALAEVRVVNDRPYAMGLVRSGDGLVVIAKSLTRLDATTARLPGTPRLVLLQGDRALGTAIRAPATGWLAALGAGRFTLDNEPWRIVRLVPSLALASGGTLAVLVPEADYHAERRYLTLALGGSFAVAALAALALAVVSRGRRVSGPPRSTRIPVVAGRHREVAVLHALAASMDRGASIERTAEQTLNVVAALAGTTAGAVYRLDPGGETLVLVAHRGIDDKHLDALRCLPAAGVSLGAAVQSGRSMVAELRRDADVDPWLRDWVAAGGYHSLLTLAIEVDGALWGVMTLAATTGRTFTGDEVRLFEAMTHQLGLAVSRAAVVASAQATEHRLQTLIHVTRTLTTTLALDDVLQRVSEAAIELFRGSVVRLWLVDEDGEHLSLRATAGGHALMPGRHQMRIGEGLVGTVVATRAPLTVENLATDPRTMNQEQHSEDLVAFAGVPLRVGGRLLGALAVALREAHAFSGDELALLQSLADHAAIAIDNAQAFTAERGRRDYLAAVLEINKKIGAVVSTDALLTSIAEEAARLLDVDNAGFRLVDGDELVLAGLAGRAGETMVRQRIKIGESFSGRVVAEGRTIVAAAESIFDLVPEHRDADRRLGYTSFLGVPLLVGERIIGVMAFRARRPFTQHDRELAEAFAGQAAVAIEQARLHQGMLRQAERMRALTEVGRLVSEALDPTIVSQRVVDSVCVFLGAHSAALYRLEPESGQLVVVTLTSDATRAFRWTERLARGEGMAGLAVRERGPVATSDVLADDRLEYSAPVRHTVEQATHRALLATPLLVRDRLFGVLVVADRTGRVFEGDEIRLAAAFADQAALALENARLFSLERSRRTQIEALAEVERELAAELNPDRLLWTIVERATALFGANGAIYLLEGDRLTPGAWTEHGSFSGYTVALGQGVVGTAAELRRGLIENDYPHSPYALADFVAAGVRTAMAHPLLIRDTLVGIITMNRVGDEAAPFGPDDLATLESFATQAAIALDNARLYREAREQTDRLRALEQVNRLVSSSLRTDEILKNVAQAVAEFFETPDVSVWVSDERAQRFIRMLVHAGANDLGGRLVRELAFGDGAVGWAAQHRTPILWTDVASDPRVVDGALLMEAGLRYLTAYPIVIGERVLGVFTVGRATPSATTPETMTLLGSLAAQAAVALENARLYSETTRRLEETRVLLDVAEILNSTLDSRQLLERVTMKIAQVCRVDRCTLELWDGRAVRPLTAQFADGRREPELWRAFLATAGSDPHAVPAHQRAIETRRPVVVEDAAHTDLIPADWASTYGIKAYLVVPMIRQDQIMGVMNLDYCDRHERFADWQIDRAMAIAGQLALSLENTRLYTELQERLRETETLLAIGAVLSRPAPPADLLRRVAREVAKAFGAEMVGAYGLEPGRDRLVPVAGYRVPKDLLEFFRGSPIVIERSPWLARAWRAGGVAWSSNSRNADEFDQEWSGAFPPYSVLFAPLKARGEPIGGLFLVWWETGRAFSPADVRLLEAVAGQLGLAIENEELSRQTEAKLRETETLLSVSRAMSSTLDLDDLMRHFCRRVGVSVDADSVGLWLIGDDGDHMEARMGYHVPPARLATLQRLRISITADAFYAEAARTRRPVWTRDVEADPRVPRWIVEAVPHQTHLFAPIIAKDRVIGGFAAVWWERARDISPDELALVDAIGHQVGVAIENARLFQENSRQVQELSVLHELSRAVTGELDREALLEAIQQQVARVLDVTNMLIIFNDPHRDEMEVVLRVMEGRRDMRTPLRYPTRAVGLMYVVLQTRRPVRTDDYLAECRRYGVQPVPLAIPLRHWLGVPLIVGDTVLGVMALRSATRGFTEGDERLLANIAHLAALALRSARLYEERTRALGELAAAQDQLVRTEKLRALGEMASGVAHDFNNLLASILGRAQLGLRRTQDPQLREWLDVIERAALDGAQTVRRLQEFTRVRRDHPLVPVDLNEVVRDALDITQSRWREEPLSRGVVIDVETALGPLPPVAGDPAELREAMTNLILNAVDAMPHGGRLTVGTVCTGDEIELSVADTGVGMPAEVREKIFDPFFTTKGPQGTGLGLSMTYGILARHGARIGVESEPGRGSTFRLTFATSGTMEAPAPVPVVTVVPPSEALRCLVVDDEPAVGTMLGDVLNMGGHQVTVLEDGVEAIERARAERFDVVFTDLAMPRVSGWQVSRAIRELAPETVIYVVTGFGVELSPEQRRAHGVDAVFLKPLKIEEILNAVAAAAVRRTRGPAGREPDEL